MKTIYAEQAPGFGLGNFINLTPTLKALSYENKIQVWFNDKFIRDCFVDCPFFEILDRRQPFRPQLHSGMINLKNDKPDYQFVWEKFFRSSVSEHTYVDIPYDAPEAAFIGSYAVVLNGSGSPKRSYIEKKDPGHEAYNRLMNQLGDLRRIFVGTADDFNRMVKANITDSVCKHIRTSLSIIAKSSMVIANDCGLAHAAGAMNKPLYILWKDTMLTKNMNPGKNTVYITKSEWETFDLEKSKIMT